MNCVGCGVTNLEGAVHCHNCGVKLVLERPVDHAQGVAAIATKDQLRPVKDYLHYVVPILKRPHVEAFAKNRHQLLFGAINIIAFAVLFGLTTWFFMDTILDVFGLSASIVSSFRLPVIASALFLAIGGCIAV